MTTTTIQTPTNAYDAAPMAYGVPAAPAYRGDEGQRIDGIYHSVSAGAVHVDGLPTERTGRIAALAARVGAVLTRGSSS